MLLLIIRKTVRAVRIEVLMVSSDAEGLLEELCCQAMRGIRSMSLLVSNRAPLIYAEEELLELELYYCS